MNMKKNNIANPSFVKGKKKRNKHGRLKPEPKNSSNTLLVNNPKEKWFEIELEVLDTADIAKPDNELVISLSQKAEELLLRDTNIYNEKRSRDRRSDFQWMKTVMSQGTSADKIAAHTVQVQDSPVHSLIILRNLIGMVRVGKKNECISAMETLCELWLTDLLNPDAKLRTFSSRPLDQLEDLSETARDKCLVLWWFEHNLKDLYQAFVKALDSLARESVDSGREKAITAMCQLLADSPEQEQLLLSQVVNKLGDPQQKVASKTIYCLNKVLDKHPNMQPVVLAEVEKMLFRANIGHKAQYYALCFLSQFKLHSNDQQLAVDLIRVYFCFFKSCIKKGELDSRMLSVLLMGVNRAFPYGQNILGDELSQHLDTMHRVVHLSPFNVALHALCLLYQVAEASSAVGDRFYTALYKKLLDPHLLSSTHHATFLNLLYKAVNSDTEVSRVQAFVKRILQVCAYAPVPLTCGMLYLVSQVLRHKKGANAVNMKAEAEAAVDSDSDDGEEKYEDIKPEGEESDNEKEKKEEKKPTTSSWVHQPVRHSEKSKKIEGYDGTQRNPLFCGAEKAVFTELSALARHHHPTVSLFASNILENKPTEYTGDPLQDFTTTRFLDRFVFKNPKKLDKEAASNHFAKRKEYRPRGMKSLSVTSKSYLNEEEQRIPCEEVFLYRYLQKKKEPWLKPEKGEDDDSDADSVASDEFEQFLHGSGQSGMTKDDDEQPDFADDVGGEFSDGGDDGSSSEEDESPKKKKGKKQKGRKRDMDDDYDEEDEDDMDLPDVFASADEFAEMLQDTGASSLDVAGSNVMENQDNADVKQLNWEANRDRWMKRGDKNFTGKRKAKTNFTHSNKKKIRR